MNKLAQTFLTDDERQKVTAAVKEAEKITSGEIVPMIVSRSHEYPFASALGAFLLSLPTALLVASLVAPWLWRGGTDLLIFLPIFLVLLLLSYPLVAKQLWLQRFFLVPSEVQREVERAALAAFYHEQLDRTKDANGILLYISVLEQKVFILGDRGINDRLAPETWADIIASLTTDIKRHNRCEGICKAVAAIGTLLRQHFPYQKNDTDELHNLIIR